MTPAHTGTGITGALPENPLRWFSSEQQVLQWRHSPQVATPVEETSLNSPRIRTLSKPISMGWSDPHPVLLIDGEAFLLLNQSDIIKILGIKLGPALKIYNAILMFKTAEEN